MALTELKKQILEQVVLGRQTKEIAHQLGLNPRTVDVHRSHILHKMGARNAIDLVRKTLSREEPSASDARSCGRNMTASRHETIRFYLA